MSNSKYSMKSYLENYKDSPKMRKIFGDYLCENEVCVFAGKAGLGKTLFAYQLADCISKGESLLNQVNETEPKIVLYIDAENSSGTITRRYKEIESNDNFLRPDFLQIQYNQLGDMRENGYTSEAMDSYKTTLDKKIIDYNPAVRALEFILSDLRTEGNKPEVIIIDNMSKFSPQSVTDQEVARLMMDYFVNLGIRYRATIIVVAHTTKHLTSPLLDFCDIAGSQTVNNFAESIFMIGKSNKNEKHRYLKQVKYRNADQMEDVLVVKKITADYDKMEFVEFASEKELVFYSQVKENAKVSKATDLKVLTNKIFDCNEALTLTYTDILKRYEATTGLSNANGKKVISQLLELEYIIKIDGKYKMNLE